MRRHVAILGGSFDPVHLGHVALSDYFVRLFKPDELRIVPAGNPWQKSPLKASAQDRVNMLELAFSAQTIPIVIDCQEIERTTSSYTIDTLQAVRAEVGPDVCLLFLIGADQLMNLNTWRQWRDLFDYAHICAASRPGFQIDGAEVPEEVADEFNRRAGSIEELLNSAHGRSHCASELDIDISATQIRHALQQGTRVDSLVPRTVLDYIEQHHLYRN